MAMACFRDVTFWPEEDLSEPSLNSCITLCVFLFLPAFERGGIGHLLMTVFELLGGVASEE